MKYTRHDDEMTAQRSARTTNARKWWKRAHRAIRVMRRNHKAAELDLLLFTTPDKKKDGD